MRTLGTVIVAFGLVAGLGLYLGSRDWGGKLQLPLSSPSCTVRAEGTVSLNAEQMANAATIAAVGIRRNMPDRAIVVALATALQESKLQNLERGDRDSIGLFQQRPSQGWGTPEQISNPRYAAGRFYSALRKVPGWERMRVTDAAQTVQRSAYPEAYQKWADDSTVLATALLGQATGAVSCSVRDDPPVRGGAAADSLARGLRADWGKHAEVSATEAPGVSVLARSHRAGWQYAHWLVSHADGHGVRRIAFGDHEWTAAAGSWTRLAEAGGRAGGTDRVVVEVFAEA